MPENSSIRNAVAASRGRLDFSTMWGVAIAVGGVVGGLLLEKGNVQDIAQATAAMIVVGGTMGAVLVSTPLPVVLRAIRALRSIFFEAPVSPKSLIEILLQLALSARRHGIVSLETDIESLTDPFLRKAIGLAVDGADLQELKHVMEIDLAVMEQNGEDEAKMWESAGGYAPTIGIIGAVLGLIQVMKHLDDIKVVGQGIAVAFVATLYGVASANFLLLPAAAKLRARLREAVLMKELTLEGVVSISQGMNPTMIRMKLEAFGRHSGSQAQHRRAPLTEPALQPVAADGSEPS